MDHTFVSDINLIGYDMILFRYDMIFLGLIYQIHNLLVPLVVVLINGVKKQVPQVSYKTVAGDLIPFHIFGYVLNLFRYDLISDMILFGSYFKIQKLSVMLCWPPNRSLSKLQGKGNPLEKIFEIYSYRFHFCSFWLQIFCN